MLKYAGSKVVMQGACEVYEAFEYQVEHALRQTVSAASVKVLQSK